MIYDICYLIFPIYIKKKLQMKTYKKSLFNNPFLLISFNLFPLIFRDKSFSIVLLIKLVFITDFKYFIHHN